MNQSPFKLHSLPFLYRMGICALVVTLLGGYIISGVHLRWHYDNRDETPGLTMNDIVGAYHGVQTPSPLITALESGHPTFAVNPRRNPNSLGEDERAALLTWLKGNRVSVDYDNLDLGDMAPSEIIAVKCLNCHTRSASGQDASPDIPLEYWDDISKLATSKNIQPAGTDIVAASQHVHAPMMAIVMLVLALFCAFTRFSTKWIGMIVFISGAGLLIDMAGWWLTREFAAFAYAIVVGGGLYAIGTLLLGLIILLDCVFPAHSHQSD